jgi:hypothetical protein
MALLRSIIFIPLFSLFLFHTSSNAMDDSKAEKGNSTPKKQRYFHSQDTTKKQEIINTTNNANSRGESSESTDTAENNVLKDSTSEEEVYTEATKIKKSTSASNLLNRVKSGGHAIKEIVTPDKDNIKNVRKKVSRVFSNKSKGTDKEDNDKGIEEKESEPENQIIHLTPVESPVMETNDSAPERKRVQRHRSWGKKPHIIIKKTDEIPSENNEGNNNPQQQLSKSRFLSASDDNIPFLDEKTAMLPQENLRQARGLRRGKSAYELNLSEENTSRKEQRSKKRLSHGRPLERSPSEALHRQDFENHDEELSPRQYRNLQLSGSYQKNLLQEGLSLYLDQGGQPLTHQPTSPRYQPISPRYQQPSPRLAHSVEKKASSRTIRSADSEEYLEESNENEESFVLSLDQQPSLCALRYEKDRGNASFIKIIDNRLFRPDPRVVVGMGVLGSLMFATLPPTAMTGINVNVTGYYFGIPPGEWLSTTLVTTFMTTFTLALLKEGYEGGQTIGWPIWKAMKACYACCGGTKDQEDILSAPLFIGAEYTWKIGYKKSLLHYGINGFSLIAALSEGILPAALLSSVWAKDFSNLIIPFGACLLMRYTGQAYNANTRILRYLLKGYLNQEPNGKFVYMDNNRQDEETENNFYEQNLHPEQATRYKKAVREAIQRSLCEVKESDEIAKEKYEIVNVERDKIKGLSIDEKAYFALSALMNRPTIGVSANISNMGKVEFCPPTLNCLKIHYQNSMLLLQKPIEFIKIPLKALALVGAGMAIEQGVKIVLQYWQPDASWTPLLINASSGTLIAFYATKELLHIAKAVKEYNAPKASLATVSNFSLASFGAIVPAGFSALVGVALGFQYVDESESSQKWKALTIAYAFDTFLSGHSHFKNKLQGFLTAAVTTIPEYTKECVVEYTPQIIKRGVAYLKEGIVNNTPECLTKFMSQPYDSLSGYLGLFHQRSWLWSWHHDLDEKVNDDNDAVTNASLYFTTQENQSADIYSDDEFSNNRENVEYLLQ